MCADTVQSEPCSAWVSSNSGLFGGPKRLATRRPAAKRAWEEPETVSPSGDVRAPQCQWDKNNRRVGRRLLGWLRGIPSCTGESNTVASLEWQGPWLARPIAVPQTLSPLSFARQDVDTCQPYREFTVLMTSRCLSTDANVLRTRPHRCATTPPHWCSPLARGSRMRATDRLF